ncbi:hypothetical protein RhiirC2_469125 [Rhizophagus irregularis]|uniref:Uncharacterized protein n=1 Tax=Rhizophagus irregularis TaxID=588596 RepID=A0A2N1N8Z5_9GLOM|nr:hypothetical protein RhiirC2_469125 [Rhizophagus irregularis]
MWYDDQKKNFFLIILSNFNCSTIQLFNCSTTIQISNCSTIQLFNDSYFSTVLFFNCLTFQLFYFSTVLLYNWFTFQMSNCRLVIGKTGFFFFCTPSKKMKCFCFE